MLPRIITSWDDGDPRDVRIAQLLLEYELPGIFFWTVKAVAHKPEWTFDIAKHFEIGAHTVNHVHLTAVDYETAANEIIDGKEWLENAYGKPIEWFCYPRGRYSPDVLKLVDEAGYKYARTTKVGNWDGKPGLEIRADIHCFNRKEYDGIPWLEYALTSWENAKANNLPTFHIWGHSHEINKYDDWFNLETLLKKIYEDLHSQR
jgi:peptidoglycan/xylan/chitin deacetylase (PgdA/CDA1 family)